MVSCFGCRLLQFKIEHYRMPSSNNAVRRLEILCFLVSLMTLAILLIPSWPGRRMMAKLDTTLPEWAIAVGDAPLSGRILPHEDWCGRAWYYITENKGGISDQPVFRLAASAFPAGCCVDWFSTGQNSLRAYTNGTGGAVALGCSTDLLHPSNRGIQRGSFTKDMLAGGLDLGVLADKHGGVFFRVTPLGVDAYKPFSAAIFGGGGLWWQAAVWTGGVLGLVVLGVLYALTGRWRYGVLALAFIFLYGGLVFEHPFKGMGGQLDHGDDSYYVAYTQNLLKHGNWFVEPTHLEVGKNVVQHNHGLPGISLFLAPGAVIQSLLEGRPLGSGINLPQLRGMRLVSASYSFLAIVFLFLALHVIRPWWGNIPLAAFLLWGTSLSQWTYNRCIFTHSVELMLLCGLLLAIVSMRKRPPNHLAGLLIGLLSGLLCLVRGEYIIMLPLVPWLVMGGDVRWTWRQRGLWLVLFIVAALPFEVVNIWAAHQLTTGYATAGTSSIFTKWSDIGAFEKWMQLVSNCRVLFQSYAESGVILGIGLAALLVMTFWTGVIPAWAAISCVVVFFLANACFPIPLGSEWQHRYSLKLYPFALLACAAFVSAGSPRWRRGWGYLLLAALAFSYGMEFVALSRHEAWGLPGTVHGNGVFLLSDLLITTKGMVEREWLFVRYGAAMMAVGLSALYLAGGSPRSWLRRAVVVAACWLLVTIIPDISWGLTQKNSGLGFHVQDFLHPDLEGGAGARIEDYAFRDYGRTSPSWWLWRRKFSSRWSGTLHAPASAQYDFFMEADAGARLWIDGNCVVDNWDNREWRGSGRHAVVDLSKGAHSIMIEHCKRGKTAAIRLKWEGGPVPSNTILGIPFVSAPAGPRAPR